MDPIIVFAAIASIGIVFLAAAYAAMLDVRNTWHGGWRTRYVCRSCDHISTYQHEVSPICTSCGEANPRSAEKTIIARPVGLRGWEIKS